ncbi:hypothetical protein M426DRAFT_151789 [Hypoxylon sp. CI-4A]|nr:hypothetical protein M426DRAFT_151789 [Hypoxylon sp. CI-4A]
MGKKNREREDSPFQKGLKRLENPLRAIKMVIDLADPLLSLDLTAKTASGVVRSVITLSIALCGAEAQFGEEIVTMLENIPIIDQCDTLDQKLDSDKRIHKALVMVHKDLIKYYITAIAILETKTGVVTEQFRQRMPPIIKDFNRHASLLEKQVDVATAVLVKNTEILLQDENIRQLLHSDKDKARSEFHSETQKIRADEACLWIINDFNIWYDMPTSQQMVILGDVGCGKTVTMTYFIDELLRRNEAQMPKPLICFHYCKDDETGKATFIYSSLILQLIDQQEDLKIAFDDWYGEIMRSCRIDPTLSSQKLGEFLARSVQDLERPLFVILDGLDECDYISRMEILTLFNDLTSRASHFKICFSSRYQREIEELLNSAMKVHVPTNIERDAIIVEHTVEANLFGLKPDTRKLVTEGLNAFAKGSAIWVRLSVDLIHRRKISAPGPLKAFIQNEISHAALPKLYAKLMAQASQSDPENERIIINALQILAVAKRPMSIAELSWAVTMADLPGEVGTIREVRHYVDEQRISDLIQPFVSGVDLRSPSGGQVRFVHQSLKELILQTAPSDWSHSRQTNKPSRIAIQQRHIKLEADLLRLCVCYLLMEEFDEVQYPYEIYAGHHTYPGGVPGDLSDSELEIKRKLEWSFGELFNYASCLWTYHFRRVEAESLPIIPKIVELTRTGSNRLANWSAKHDLFEYWDVQTYQADPLFVVAMCGPEVALQHLLQAYDIHGPEFQHQSAHALLHVLMDPANISKLRLLFSKHSPGEVSFTVRFFSRAISMWQYHGATESASNKEKLSELFDLVRGPATVALALEKQIGELLIHAASNGCLPMIEILFDEAAHNSSVRQELLPSEQAYSHLTASFQAAIRQNHVDILRHLISQEGTDNHIRFADEDGNNVIHFAAEDSNLEILELLVPYFQGIVDHVNNEGETPLCWIVRDSRLSKKRIESARLLLEVGGVDVRAGYKDHPEANMHEPLRMAARYGDAEMCRCLVEVGGADPRSVLRMEDGHPSLLDQNWWDEKESPKVLETLCSLAGIETPTQKQDQEVTTRS